MAKFSQFDIPNLSFVIRLVALAAALGVSDERLLELIGETEVFRHQPTVARRGLPV